MLEQLLKLLNPSREDQFGYIPFPSPTETGKDCINRWCPKQMNRCPLHMTSLLCLTNSLISEGYEKQRPRLWHICKRSKQNVKWGLLSAFPTLYEIFTKFILRNVRQQSWIEREIKSEPVVYPAAVTRPGVSWRNGKPALDLGLTGHNLPPQNFALPLPH